VTACVFVVALQGSELQLHAMNEPARRLLGEHGDEFQVELWDLRNTFHDHVISNDDGLSFREREPLPYGVLPLSLVRRMIEDALSERFPDREILCLNRRSCCRT
jgi:hypothetical protein